MANARQGETDGKRALPGAGADSSVAPLSTLSRMDDVSTSDLWHCEGCGRSHRPVRLQPGEEAQCGQCGTRLRVRARTGPHVGLAWTLTALGLFLAASLLPVLTVEKGGIEGAASLFVVAQGLGGNGMPVLGFIAGALVVWLPLVALILLLMLNLGAVARWSFPGAGAALAAVRFARQWAMPEVFLLSILVAFLKLGDLATAAPGPGLWFLVGGALALLAAFQRVERDGLEFLYRSDRVRAHGGSRRASLALLLAALILLLPANLLPIMEVSLPGEVQSGTIVGGVLGLIEHGFWGIAAIVFIASVVVPFAKIGGLGWLLWAERRRPGSRAAMRLYRLIDFIGRWSMLDIFLIGLLAGLIRFGALAEVRAGPAAPAFAAAVILTVLAVEQFDPRRIWSAPRGDRAPAHFPTRTS
jgi:paraquat-inducible protein A